MTKKLDLIDRGALGIGKANPLAFEKEEYAHGWNNAIEIIQNAPTVDAVPVVHGRWEKEDQSGISIDGYMVCSACNVMIPKPDYNRYCLHRLNFCPNCGADMRGDRDGRKDP